MSKGPLKTVARLTYSVGTAKGQVMSLGEQKGKKRNGFAKRLICALGDCHACWRTWTGLAETNQRQIVLKSQPRAHGSADSGAHAFNQTLGNMNCICAMEI